MLGILASSLLVASRLDERAGLGSTRAKPPVKRK